MGTVLSTAAPGELISKSVDVVTKNISGETAVGILLTVPFVFQGVAALVVRCRGDGKGGKGQQQQQQPPLPPKKEEEEEEQQLEEITREVVVAERSESPLKRMVRVGSEFSITDLLMMRRRKLSVDSEETGLTATEADLSLDASLDSMSANLFSDLMRQSLIKQVLKSDHAGKVNIGESLHKLGENLYRQGKYQQAAKTLERSQEVRKIVIGETMASLAAVMTKQAAALLEHGNEQLSDLYVSAAKALRDDPGPMALQRACGFHRQHRIGHTKKALRSLSDKVDRRLHRASQEAKSLSRTFKMLAQCKEYGSVDFY